MGSGDVAEKSRGGHVLSEEEEEEEGGEEEAEEGGVEPAARRRLPTGVIMAVTLTTEVVVSVAVEVAGRDVGVEERGTAVVPGLPGEGEGEGVGGAGGAHTSSKHSMTLHRQLMRLSSCFG